MCALAVWSEKVQRTISRLFEYEKIVLFKYMYCNIFVLLLRVRRAKQQILAPTRSSIAFSFFFVPCVIPLMYFLILQKEASSKANLNSQQLKYICTIKRFLLHFLH